MSISKEISELLDANVISVETAENIQNYYRRKREKSPNILMLAFGILGAILVGLGIILILAHNWDELAKTTKTIISFLPLVAAQALCLFSLIKKRESKVWRESSAALLFFGVGASISLISQIYHIEGDVGSFLLTWMLLCFPVIYFMRSSITSLLYIIGITYFALETGYWSYPAGNSQYYWPLLLLVLPYYLYLFKNHSSGNFLNLHNWALPISLTMALGTVAASHEEFLFIAYSSLFGLFYIIGQFDSLKNKIRLNGFQLLGSAGTIVLLLIVSFEWSWEHIKDEVIVFNELVIAPEFIASVAISIAAAGLLYFYKLRNKSRGIQPFEWVFIVFIIIFIIGLYSSTAVILVNILVLALGIVVIIEGAKKNHFGLLNYGLLIITALIICRFFDTSLSFVFRGILFVIVGAGFFATNYWMLKKRKTNEK